METKVCAHSENRKRREGKEEGEEEGGEKGEGVGGSTTQHAESSWEMCVVDNAHTSLCLHHYTATLPCITTLLHL